MRFKANCSAIGAIMSDPRTKGELFSETCRDHVRAWYLKEVYGRKKLIVTSPMLKGTQEETASLMTLEEFRKERGLFKNEKRFENEWIKGYPDVINGDEIIEVKTPFDIFTFHKAKGTHTPRGLTAHGWQLLGYLGLTNKNYGTLAHVLTDSPDWLVRDEVRKAYYSMKIETDEENDFFAKNIEPSILANHKYSSDLEGFPNIPINERVKEYEMEFDADRYKNICERVDLINEVLKKKPQEIWK